MLATCGPGMFIGDTIGVAANEKVREVVSDGGTGDRVVVHFDSCDIVIADVGDWT